MEIRRFACDSCRRRRIRCNGEQPCDRCEISGISCTFGSTLSRTSSVSYARKLEQRIVELERLLQIGSPLDLGGSDHQDAKGNQVIDLLLGPNEDYVSRVTPDTVRFYRYYAAFNVLRTVADMCGRKLTPLQPPTKLGDRMLEALEISSSLEGNGGVQAFLPALPQMQRVFELVERTVATALICHDCLDCEDFSLRLHRLYEVDSDKYSHDDMTFLALVYAVLACGKRYGPRDNDSTAAQGVSDFRASCATLRRESIFDLNSIRALILQARYLLSMSMTSTAYSITCTAISAALRMGLDSSSNPSELAFTAAEHFRRRQVFAVLYMMDTYLASLLGMSKILNRVDEKQTLGLRDEDLADAGQSFIAQSPTSTVSETVVCQKLFQVFAKILDSDFVTYTVNAEGTHTIPTARAAALESDIVQWASILRHPTGDPPSIRAVHAQLSLRLYHAVAQITLYRPFLHHLSRDREDLAFNLAGYDYASKCVQASAQAIWIVEAFQTHGTFHEAIWVNTYALAFSATILCYFVMCSKQRATIEENRLAAFKARELLKVLAVHNNTAMILYQSLDPLVDSLSEFPCS